MASSRFLRIAMDRARAAAVAVLGVEVQADPAGRAQSWLSGTGDLLSAGLTGRVPLAVRLGVLANADISRLTDLGRHCRRGSVRRSWGTEMARLTGDIAQHTGTAEALAAFQRRVVQPLELELLAGRVTFASTSDLIAYLRWHLSAVEV
jgi:hypothetical protein